MSYKIAGYNIVLSDDEYHNYKRSWETDHFNGECRGVPFSDYVYRLKEQERFNQAVLPQGVEYVKD